MREVRFHRELYRGEHVDEAIKVYDRFASLERAEEERYWVVRVTSKTEERERRIADELANYALGLSVESRGGV